jgi:hypothetical protein
VAVSAPAAVTSARLAADVREGGVAGRPARDQHADHDDRIERIAIVALARWRSESLMFAAADLRKAPVEFFGEGAMADARR